MTFNWPIIGDKIFGILKGSGFKLQMFDKTGKKTLDPHEATRFFATISSHDPELKEFSILIGVHDENAASHVDIKTPNLKDQRDFDTMRRINTSLKRNVGDREGISINWLKFDHAIEPKQDAFNNITESKDISKPFGSTKSSFQKVGNSKLIIRHTDTIDEEKVGSRWRHVKAIFIETRLGERFLYPHMHIAGARAMARHLSNDGSMHDEIGEAIKQLSSDYMDLKRSGRMLRHAGDESKISLLSEALQEINKQVKRMCGPRGYATTTPTLTEKVEVDEAELARIHADLMERCGCQDGDPAAQPLGVAAKYLVGKEEPITVDFMMKPDLVSKVHEYPDHKQRLAWQIGEMAECAADPEVKGRLGSIADALRNQGIIGPEDMELVKAAYRSSKDEGRYLPEEDVEPVLERIRSLSGI